MSFCYNFLNENLEGGGFEAWSDLKFFVEACLGGLGDRDFRDIFLSSSLFNELAIFEDFLFFL